MQTIFFYLVYRTQIEKEAGKEKNTEKTPIRELNSTSPPAKKRKYVKVVNKNTKKSA